METICVPPTAASKKLHLGNLYTWILIDAYRKAKIQQGDLVFAEESWNCYSQKLEEKVRAEIPFAKEERIIEKCKQEVTDAINLGQREIKKYQIVFDEKVIRDDSEEYSAFVSEYIKNAEMEHRIINGMIKIPSSETILERVSKIRWAPKGIEKRLNGSKTLQNISKIGLFRKGTYGVFGKNGEVYGQRFIQSLLPEFYSYSGKNNLSGIFGNDVLTKWIYFMIANSKKSSFKNIALSGMILDHSGKKISKYTADIPLLKDLEKFNPDCVRLGLLKKTFGNDFKVPEFKEEEKLRRKVVNCVRYLSSYANISEMKNSYVHPNLGLSLEYRSVLDSVTSFKFNEGYNKFRKFICDKISKKVIGEVKLNRISKRDKQEILNVVRNLGEIFTPTSLDIPLT